MVQTKKSELNGYGVLAGFECIIVLPVPHLYDHCLCCADQTHRRFWFRTANLAIFLHCDSD